MPSAWRSFFHDAVFRSGHGRKVQSVPVPARLIRFLPFATVLFLSSSSVHLQPLQALESKMAIGQGILNFDSSEDLFRMWEGMEKGERHVAAAYFIENLKENPRSGPKEKLYALLSGSTDPVLLGYNVVARAYLEEREPSRRMEVLQRSYATRTELSYRALLRFFMALQAMDSGKEPSLPDLLGICQVPDQQQSCNLSRLIQKTAILRGSRSLNRPVLQGWMDDLRPFLTRGVLAPPFFSEQAALLPAQVYSLGFPLEAAILTERMSSQDQSPLALRQKDMIPYYLASTSDFHSAIQLLKKESRMDDVLRKNLLLDWMILSGAYRDAAEMIEREGPDRLALHPMGGLEDYWTGFKYSPGSYGLKFTLLLYLAGDVKSAATALKKLTDMMGENSAGEPYKYYARLRLAQILLEENPDLAHKIAEDVTYTAQAKGWTFMEYQATILDGWALYFQKEYFRAIVNFIKAGGILKEEEREKGSLYSRLLGVLAARIKLNPGGDYSDLIAQIGSMLQNRPYNKAIFTIKEWAPAGAGPDFFNEVAGENLRARGEAWKALDLVVDRHRRSERFYRPGKNPGGLRGLSSSLYWMEELRKFSYSKLLPSVSGLPAPTDGARNYALSLLPGIRDLSIQESTFNPYEFYVLSYPVEKGRILYLLYPYEAAYYRGRGKRRRRYTATVSAIHSMLLNGEETAKLKKKCPFGENSPCSDFQEKFSELRHFMAGRRTVALNILYTGDFDIDYEGLLNPRKSQNMDPVYFAGTNPIKEQKWGGEIRSYTAARCPFQNNFPGTEAVSDFASLFSTRSGQATGIWFWPDLLDENRNQDGGERPVYLRRFFCGNTVLRFWDMDRFHGPAAPDAVVYRRREGEEELNQAFVRHFSERGTILMEVDGSWNDASSRLFTRTMDKNSKNGKILSLIRGYLALRGEKNSSAMRIILPGVLK